MATIKPGVPSYDSYVARAEESTFGTAIADDQNFAMFKLLDNAVTGFVPEQYVDDSIKNKQKNMGDITDMYKSENGLWQRYQIPNFYATSSDLAHMLYGVTQIVTEGAAAQYVKTYTQAGATKPDFSTDAGYFFTLLVEEPFASFASKLTSCVLDNLTLSFSPDNGGRCIASASVLTGKGYIGTANPSGTNAYDITAVPSFFDATSTLSISGVDCVFYNVSINYQTTYDFGGHSSGNAENYIVVGQKVTGSVTIKFDTGTQAFKNSKGTTMGAFAFNIGTNAAPGYYSFVCNDSWCTGVAYDRGGTDTVQKLTLEFDFKNDLANTQYCVTEVADNVDAAW